MNSGAPLLSVAGLAVRYGEAQALSDVSLSVNRGEVVSVIGANGAGKTTLIRTIAGIIPTQLGAIHFDGSGITGWSANRIGELGIAQVAEGRQLFPNLSVNENLELGAMLKRARARRRQNYERVLTLFPRLAERRSQLAGTLSGGEQQMLAIGRCLMADPSLIMLDEPSLGLAPAMVDEIFDIVRILNREGTTILLVEQNVVESLEMCGHAFVLENGVTALSGLGTELLQDDRVRKAYMGL